MTSLIVGSSQGTPPETMLARDDFGSTASAMTSSDDRFFRRTTETPYGQRIRKLIYDAQRVAAACGQMPELLWLDGHWWTVLPLFETYKGVRFRIEDNRLRLLPQRKDRARD